MKNFIKLKLHEAIKNLPDTTFQQQLKYHKYPSLSDPSKRASINAIMARITKATNIANTSDNKEYFNSPNEGDGFYQVEFRHDGKITTKQIRPSADMQQLGGKFQPSDIGTCKDNQNIARYCFVKAGKNGKSYGASPAEDAANKALIIFKDEITNFLGISYVDPEQSAQISKEKMTAQQALHKTKKDLEAEMGHHITDAQWNEYLTTGKKPEKKTLSIDPTDIEARQAAALARKEKAMARLKK